MSKTQAFHSPGPWRQLIAVTAICPDGKIRKIRLVQSPDTFFSQRGRCRIAGLNVSGYVTTVANHMWIPRSAATPEQLVGYHPRFEKDEVMVDDPNAGEYVFRLFENDPKYDELMARIIRAQCTCGWTAGHDSRCPATAAYLDVMKKEEWAEKERAKEQNRSIYGDAASYEAVTGKDFETRTKFRTNGERVQ